LNYAKAEDVAKLIQNAKSQNKTTNNAEQAKNIDLQTASLLSPQGVVSFDERTNTLILHDSEEKLNQLRYLIAVLDVPVNQVMVEARIVRANTNFSKELGVRWGIFGARDNAKLTIGSNSNSLWDLRTEGIQQRPSRLNIDLGVANASAGTFAIGLLGLENLVLDLELSALQSEGYGEIISTPKVLTLDKQKASISTGQEMPYQVANNVSGNTVVSTADLTGLRQTSHLHWIQCYHVACATRPGVTTQSGVPLSTGDRLLLPESVPITFGGGDCLFKFSDAYRSLQGSQRARKACLHQRNTVSLISRPNKWRFRNFPTNN
jgi:hypothetical protein